MIRVLHVLGTTNLGGAESRIMDLYRHMDRERVQFDFLVHMDAAKFEQARADGRAPEEYREPGHFDEEINALGGHVYALPRYNVVNFVLYRSAIKDFFSSHHYYNVVQGHMTSTASIYLPIAKKAGVGCTVAHTRNAGVDSGLKGTATKLLRSSLYRKADYCFACSHLAGDETFGGHKYTYIPNTIDTGRFLFDPDARKEIRTQLAVPEDAVLIGNVARFNEQKNQRFLIEAFSRLKGSADTGSNKDYRLVFCGDGPLMDDCIRYAQELGVQEKVIFAGNRSDVQKFYSAMDIFAFPSKYEGLPGVVVEAQSSGLACLISDKITNEVILTDITEALDIDGDASLWTEKIACAAERINTSGRAEYAGVVRRSGFDVNDQAEKMMAFYLNPCDATLPNF